MEFLLACGVCACDGYSECPVVPGRSLAGTRPGRVNSGLAGNITGLAHGKIYRKLFFKLPILGVSRGFSHQPLIGEYGC